MVTVAATFIVAGALPFMETSLALICALAIIPWLFTLIFASAVSVPTLPNTLISVFAAVPVTLSASIALSLSTSSTAFFTVTSTRSILASTALTVTSAATVMLSKEPVRIISSLPSSTQTVSTTAPPEVTTRIAPLSVFSIIRFDIWLPPWMWMESEPPPRSRVFPATVTLLRVISPSPTPSAMIRSPEIFMFFSTAPGVLTIAVPDTLPVYSLFPLYNCLIELSRIATTSARVMLRFGWKAALKPFT